MFAAKEGHLNIVHKLISAGGDIFIKDEVYLIMYVQQTCIVMVYTKGADYGYSLADLLETKAVCQSYPCICMFHT